MTFFGKDFEIALYIKGKIDKDIEQVKRDTYTQFKQKEKELIEQMEDAIYNHYQEEFEECRNRFEEYADEWATIITKKEELANLVTLEYIVIDENCKNATDREISFLFNVTWDIEEGIGIQLINEKIDIFGCQGEVL